MTRIAIIGGGAAGMMVAATLAERDRSATSKPEIHLYEKNKELGTKVRISGGGRCNITTGYYKKQDLQHKYTRGRDFLSHAMSQFGPRKMQQRCKEHDCEIYCQDDLRCFPVSNKGSDVVAMFEKILDAGGVKIHFDEAAVSLRKDIPSNAAGKRFAQGTDGSVAGGNRLIKECFFLTTTKGTYEYDFVVITTGGNAYAHTGSTGDGYDLAKQCGHSITDLGPSLNSFLIEEERVKECSGTSFPSASLRSENTGKKNEKVSVTGPLLCTHFGISGPATFSYSSHIPHLPVSTKEPHIVKFIPFSERNMERRLSRLTEKAQQEPKKQLATILGYEFTKRRVESFLSRYQGYSQVSSQENYASIMISNLSRDQKKELSQLLGNGIPLTLIARRPGDEFVTAGGVETDEIESQTMHSKFCPGLYFAGEVLNIDGVTGGFNFQSCRATGRCAGMGITQG